jgi:hypothetical protein
MSFEIYLQVFSDEESFGIPLKEVFQSFGEHVSKLSSTLWNIHYNSENNCDIYIHGDGSEESRITGFTVYRPCDDVRLWDALFNIMGLGHVALYFPGSRVLLRNEASVQHLLTDMVSALGGYLIVNGAEEILKELSTA